LAWLSVHLAELKLFLEGLDELELVMAYSGHGLFIANHDTVLCIILHIFVYKSKLLTVNFPIAYSELASDPTCSNISKRTKIQGMSMYSLETYCYFQQPKIRCQFPPSTGHRI
jgi:hypothetical protein